MVQYDDCMNVTNNDALSDLPKCPDYVTSAHGTFESSLEVVSLRLRRSGQRRLVKCLFARNGANFAVWLNSNHDSDIRPTFPHRAGQSPRPDLDAAEDPVMFRSNIVLESRYSADVRRTGRSEPDFYGCMLLT